MSWCIEISSSISRSHSYMRTINNNSLLCGSDCKPYVYILLNSSQVQFQPNVSAGPTLPPDTRGVAEGTLEWRDSSLNQLWLKHLTYKHFTKYVAIWTSYQGLSKPWKGPAQVRDHEANLISLREHLCKVTQVKMNGRDPAWRHRQLSGTVTKCMWETMKKKGTFDFYISSLIVDRFGWFILVRVRVGGKGGKEANSDLSNWRRWCHGDKTRDSNLWALMNLRGLNTNWVGDVGLTSNLGGAGGSGGIGRLVVPSVGGMSKLKPKSCPSLSTRGPGIEQWARGMALAAPWRLGSNQTPFFWMCWLGVLLTVSTANHQPSH